MENQTAITVRMPNSLHEQLKIKAVRDDRSLNSQIVHVLKEGINEINIIKIIDNMCLHSLPPDQHTMWENIRETLFNNRKYLKR